MSEVDIPKGYITRVTTNSHTKEKKYTGGNPYMHVAYLTHTHTGEIIYNSLILSTKTEFIL